MFKKNVCFFLIVLFITAASAWGQNAANIVVPSGFRVEKVLETNKCPDPQNLAFLPSGDLLVASMMWRILQVDPTGAVTTRKVFRTNDGPNPFDIMVTPAGEIYFSNNSTLNNPGLYRLENNQPVLVTPPGWTLDYFTRDGDGNFYAVAGSVPGIGREVVKFSDGNGDGQYEDVQPLIILNAQGIVFHAGYLYLVANDKILKYDANGAQIGGPVVAGLAYPYDLAADSQGYLYTIVYDGDVVDGLTTYGQYDIVKVSPWGSQETVANDIKAGPYISISPDDVLYLSEFNRGVISKVINGNKIDVTEDTGHYMPSNIAFDTLNRPYISSFRFSQLKRIDPEARTAEAVTPALGEATQEIGVDGNSLFYLSESNRNNFYTVDPITGWIATLKVPWTRSLRFDAFGRLVIIRNSVIPGPTSDDINTTLGIMDWPTGTVTPYIAGNDLMRYAFDDGQNMYARSRRWEGIIKVPVPQDPTDPPFNAYGAPLFYDLRSKHSEIRYFDLSVEGQLLIPLVDTGEVILGKPDGTWSEFAAGFNWPGYVKFDRNGVLYVVCTDSIYRIIGRSFVIPAVSRRLQEGLGMIRDIVTDRGLATSLCKLVEGALASLRDGNVTAATKQLESLVLIVKAQRGKRIAADTSESIILGAGTIIAGLKLL